MPTAQKQDEIASIVSVIKNAVDCDKIYLFGSYAYGEPTEDSDLDFYVVVPDDSETMIEKIRQINRHLYPIRQTPVDVLASHASRFAELSQLPTLEKKIFTEGILLYERI
ncbi:MAG: nucleotidyltransferase domain-containing protein [Deltaproteobacteria bacterium]|jgi:predicted nucleotidyltransferase|nr:nucleotidyltransferase domain-containing protein [Deltaproteobacteria bacterium]